MGRIWTILSIAFAVVLLVPRAPAAALGLVTAANETVDARRLDAIVWMEGGEETLVEAVLVSPGAKRFAVLRAFPSPPKEIVPVDPTLFTVLENETRTREPFDQTVHRRLLGPSILTPLLVRLSDPPSFKVEPPLPPARVPLTTQAFTVFSGPATSSTITLERILPLHFEVWLEDAGLVLTRSQRETAARALNLGWSVVGAIVTRPDGSQPLMVGPVMYRFAAKAPLLPPFNAVGSHGPALRLYTVGHRPLVPSTRPVTWNEQPWLKGEPAIGEEESLEISYWNTLTPAAATALGILGKDRGPLEVMRGDVLARLPRPSETTLAPLANVRSIPSRTGRGSAPDLFLCLLLGLAPLLYTPESWLLLWFEARARIGKKVTDPVGWGGALWPLYALVVAVFWVVTLPGSARIAAVGPLLIGLWRLIFNEVRRERGRVLVDFKRRAKPKAAPKADASVPPKPVPVPVVVPVLSSVRTGGTAALPVKMSLAKVIAPPKPKLMAQAKLGVTIPPGRPEPKPRVPTAPPPPQKPPAAAPPADAPAPPAAKAAPAAAAPAAAAPRSKGKPKAGTPARSVMPVRDKKDGGAKSPGSDKPK